MSALKQHYDIEEDLGGELYCGINLSWIYGEGYVDISMPNYVHTQLIKYSQTVLKWPQYYSYDPMVVQYGIKLQAVLVKVESNTLDKEGTLCVLYNR